MNKLLLVPLAFGVCLSGFSAIAGEDQIKKAESAAPAAVSGDATIMLTEGREQTFGPASLILGMTRKTTQFVGMMFGGTIFWLKQGVRNILLHLRGFPICSLLIRLI